MSHRRKLLPVLCILSLLLVSGCASKPKDAKEEKPPKPVEQMYADAAHELDEGNHVEAAKAFDDVDREYPYSPWATRAQLMEGYSQYKALKYDEAVISLDHFIELHPGDDSVAYAYYLKALCYYEQISDVRRDQKMTQDALEALHQVVERFPDSKYAKDAALKADLTTDHLAGKEMQIGRYYLERHQYQAAINRYEKVVQQFQTTTHVPEALERLVECYVSLGIFDEAKKNAAILGHNYPQSGWYKDAYALMKDKQGKATKLLPLPAAPTGPVTPVGDTATNAGPGGVPAPAAAPVAPVDSKAMAEPDSKTPTASDAATTPAPGTPIAPKEQAPAPSPYSSPSQMSTTPDANMKLPPRETHHDADDSTSDKPIEVPETPPASSSSVTVTPPEKASPQDMGLPDINLIPEAPPENGTSPTDPHIESQPSQDTTTDQPANADKP